MDKKILKHDFPKGSDHIELYFKIRFYPMDVTQVLQYVTLYQVFLAAHQSVIQEDIRVSSRDSMLLAALNLQATKGDYNPGSFSSAFLQGVYHAAGASFRCSD